MSLKSGKMSIQKTSRLCWLQVVGWGSLSGIRSPWSSDWWLWSGVHHCQETWWMDVTRLDSWMTELMAWNAMTSRRIRRLNTEWCQGFDWRLAIRCWLSRSSNCCPCVCFCFPSFSLLLLLLLWLWLWLPLLQMAGRSPWMAPSLDGTSRWKTSRWWRTEAAGERFFCKGLFQ